MVAAVVLPLCKVLSLLQAPRCWILPMGLHGAAHPSSWRCFFGVWSEELSQRIAGQEGQPDAHIPVRSVGPEAFRIQV